MGSLPTEMLEHQPLLRAHCYRMLGHPQDADDAVQDTYVRAVRGVAGFEGRSSARTWLVRIATRVCLDALAARKRRRMPTEGPPGEPEGPFVPTDPDEWVAPFPDAWLEPSLPVDEQVELRHRVDLALVTALQRLPARQRAALLLAEVFDWSAAEVADTLGSSVASVNSALQRARARLGGTVPGRAEVDPIVVARYREAFVRHDVDALVGLLTDDVTFDMPPLPLWLQGPERVGRFLRSGPGAHCKGSKVVPLGDAGYAQYRQGGQVPWALVFFETRDGRVSAIHHFLDVGTLFPLFGLPDRLDEESPMSSAAERGLSS
ncbi:MAG: RNA polymerase subunit sigma-70 [Myxococcales bacterium]|nr:RNA polymerase subunit sigma-70 [Myxococcales bacterium]